MIDHLEKQTQPLELEPKRGRGRPAKGQALSNAERQRRYREAQKAQRNEKTKVGPAWEDVAELTKQIDSLTEELKKALERADLAEARADVMGNELAIVKAQLSKPARVKRHRDQPAIELQDEDVPDKGVWTVQFKQKGQRSWASCEPQIDFEGVPWGFRRTRQHVLDMSKDAGGTHWRAVRNDGLVIDPKALK
ncbi:hypothetical protein [Pseudomonas sp. WS 5011]|uniref:hypothetical protein n=1 Tax=Pseudomonas sp. WS 5011 TaxID=2717477 RepID=UPI001473FC43|nr:hypothetical protein [Pseudomonas sp. WS 5011]NMY53437.1 hypothetical protein [Pseudomonas sp. WS 5011]NMY53448.1 hypothetical protein [Pseudomonas sp. WS 5011]